MPLLLQSSPSIRNPCPLQDPSAGAWVLPHLPHTWTLHQHPLPQAPLTKGWLLWHQELNLWVWLVHNSTLAVRAGQTQRNKTKPKFAVSRSIPCLVRDVLLSSCIHAGLASGPLLLAGGNYTNGTGMRNSSQLAGISFQKGAEKHA